MTIKTKNIIGINERLPVNLFTRVVFIIAIFAICEVRSFANPASEILKETGIKGGLVVHLGCGDGKLTSELYANKSYLIHGLDSNPENIAKARNYIEDKGVYGKVSVELFDGDSLPYVEDFVNLIVSENTGKISEAEMMRVLVPKGVAYIKRNGSWNKIIKPKSKEIDDWTHYLYNSSNCSTSNDRKVGSPKRLKWIGSPKWARSHDVMSSTSAMVSAGGKIFYIIDEGSTASVQLPAKWTLIARDAFNGVVLWKRSIPVWHTHLYPLKSGPIQLARRLVAVDDKVYVTLGLYAPVVKLDANTGETLLTYADTERTEEILFNDGNLFLLTNPVDEKQKKFVEGSTNPWARGTGNPKTLWRPWSQKELIINAINADSGEKLWSKKSKVHQVSMAVNQKAFYYINGEEIVCIDRNSGSEKWRFKLTGKYTNSNSSPVSIVLYKDLVLFAQARGGIVVLSENGKKLWDTKKHDYIKHFSSVDIPIINGLIWSVKRGTKATGFDPWTGELKEEISLPGKVPFHDRCHRSKAVKNALITGMTGIELINVKEKTYHRNHWVRGSCFYGIMPANGLIYTPPMNCGCYMEGKANGLAAYAGESTNPATKTDKKLTKGSAYKKIKYIAPISETEIWKTYRKDNARSGFSKVNVSSDLTLQWSASFGEKLSSLVAAEEMVFFSSIDKHQIVAADAETGAIKWTFTAGGRIDSPPTYSEGRVVFGCSDGYVYSLQASDGMLDWKFLAGPRDERCFSYGQLESLWPVNGSVLIINKNIYCVAGRMRFLNGGLRFYKLDLETGEVLSKKILGEKNIRTGEHIQDEVNNLTMQVALPDILSYDGEKIYMRSQPIDLDGNPLDYPLPYSSLKHGGTHQFTKLLPEFDYSENQHLFSASGFLDDTWMHRSYWSYGKGYSGGAGWWWRTGRWAPSGRLLTFNEKNVFGYGRLPEHICWTTVLEYHLFSASKIVAKEKILKVLNLTEKNQYRKGPNHDRALTKKAMEESFDNISALTFNWSNRAPTIQARGMVLTENKLFVAGYPDLLDEEEMYQNKRSDKTIQDAKEQDEAIRGKRGGKLQVFSVSTGELEKEYDLPSAPTWDGMAIAYGKIYIALMNGEIICFEQDK